MADIQIDIIENVCVVRASGDITLKDLVDTKTSLYPTLNGHVIWDLMKCSLDSITSHEFQKLALIAKEYCVNRFGSKTACVADKKNTYGLSRMYTIYAEMSQSGVEYNVFESFEDALHWVTAPDPS